MVSHKAAISRNNNAVVVQQKNLNVSIHFNHLFCKNSENGLIVQQKYIEIFEIENYSVNISSGQYKEDYKELRYLETIQKMLNYVDRELIPELQQAIKGLSIAENDDRRRMRKVQNSNRQDRKHGLRVKKRPDQAYKRNRDIARAKKNATRIAFG